MEDQRRLGLAAENRLAEEIGNNCSNEDGVAGPVSRADSRLPKDVKQKSHNA